MAKIKNTEKALFNISELVGQLDKISGVDSVILGDDPDSIKIENWISTGNYALNAQISGSIFKGIPEGKTCMIAGDPGSGKSFLCLNITHDAIKQGYNVIWVDTEAAVDDETFRRFGIDLSKIIYVSINTVNSLSTYLKNFIDRLKEAKDKKLNIGKYLVIIDSLGNLSTDKEVKDVTSGSDKADMTRAQQLKKLFRVCTTDFGKLKIPVVLTNHTYDAVGAFFPTKIIGGGGGPFFNSSTVLILSTAQLKDGEAKTGIIVTSKIKKSRFTKGGIPIKFHISFYRGMNRYVGLEKYLDYESIGLGWGKLDKDGNYIEEEVTDKKVGKYVAVKHLDKHISFKKIFTSEIFTKEILEKLDEKIKPIFELPDINSDYDIEEMVELEDNETDE